MMIQIRIVGAIVLWFFQCTAAFFYVLFWVGPRGAWRGYSTQLWMGPWGFDAAISDAKEAAGRREFIRQRKARGRGRR